MCRNLCNEGLHQSLAEARLKWSALEVDCMCAGLTSNEGLKASRKSDATYCAPRACDYKPPPPAARCCNNATRHCRGDVCKNMKLPSHKIFDPAAVRSHSCLLARESAKVNWNWVRHQGRVVHPWTPEFFLHGRLVSASVLLPTRVGITSAFFWEPICEKDD